LAWNDNKRWDSITRTTIVVNAPINSVAPVLTGIGYTGQTMSVTDGTWTGTAPISYTYQWYSGATPISGETSNTYTVTRAYEGTAIYCEVTGTNVGGSSSANSNTIHNWVPSDDANLWAWWDASDSTTITTDVGVSQWDDKGSNGFDAVQATAINQPATGTTDINGLNTIYADDVASFKRMAVSTFSYPTSNDMLILFVGNAYSPNTNQFAGFLASNGPSVDWQYNADDASGYEHRFNESGGNQNAYTDGSDFSGADRIFGTVMDYTGASTITQTVDGINYTGTNGSYTVPWDSTDFRFFTNRFNAQFQGEIGEVVLSEDITIQVKLEGYLAHKWGLTANLDSGHTYKSSAPTV
jgi:hypothetical protein